MAPECSLKKCIYMCGINLAIIEPSMAAVRNRPAYRAWGDAVNGVNELPKVTDSCSSDAVSLRGKK